MKRNELIEELANLTQKTGRIARKSRYTGPNGEELWTTSDYDGCDAYTAPLADLIQWESGYAPIYSREGSGRRRRPDPDRPDTRRGSR